MSKQITYTFQPSLAVQSLLSKAATRRKGVPRTRLINEAIVEALKNLAGKREQLP